MKEIPLLFSAPMIRALLDGTKTQTRRIVTPQPEEYFGSLKCDWYSPTVVRRGEFEPGKEVFGFANEDQGWIAKAAPGDTIWVKETFKTVPVGRHVVYRADAPRNKADEVDRAFGPWKPSIFMPRRLSRIDLRVTGVRVERVNDISETDALAEGVTTIMSDGLEVRVFKNEEKCSTATRSMTTTEIYKRLWESIHGEGSWEANPIVWVYVFERIKP